MTKRNLITTAVALAVLLGAGVVAAPYLLALLPAEIISTFSIPANWASMSAVAIAKITVKLIASCR